MMLSTGTTRFNNQTSDSANSLLLWMNAAALVRFLFSFRLLVSSTKSTFEIFQVETLLYGNENLSDAEIPVKLVINRNSFRFILHLHVYSSS